MPARLEVAISLPLSGFDLGASFATDAGAYGLFGHSGSGKSTTLEVIAGLRRGARGRVVFDGKVWLDTEAGVDLPPERRGTGYMPQDGLLFPHWSVRQNILAGLRRRHAPAPVPDPDHVIRVLDLADLLSRQVGLLSGGERQRVALARALCSAPSLLLLDEPLGSIELSLRGRILHYLLRAKESFRIPALFVSHDATEVSVLCDAVSVLRDGRVIATGTPAEVFTKEDVLTELLDGDYENVLEGEVAEIDGSRAVVVLEGGHRVMVADAAGARAGGKALLGVRASSLMLAAGEARGLSARNELPGRIRDMRGVGAGVLTRISLAPGPVEVVALLTEPARTALRLENGKEIRVLAKAKSVRLLALR